MKTRIPPTTVHLIPFKTCWGCNGRATVAIRPLGLNFHRFYCTACATALRKASDDRAAPSS